MKEGSEKGGDRKVLSTERVTHRVTLPLRTPEIPPARAAVQPRTEEQRDGCQPSKVMGSKHYFSMY